MDASGRGDWEAECDVERVGDCTIVPSPLDPSIEELLDASSALLSLSNESSEDDRESDEVASNDVREGDDETEGVHDTEDVEVEVWDEEVLVT